MESVERSCQLMKTLSRRRERLPRSSSIDLESLGLSLNRSVDPYSFRGMHCLHVLWLCCSWTLLSSGTSVVDAALSKDSTWALLAWGEASPADEPSATTSVVIVDLFDESEADIAAYSSAGHTVVCYYSAGTAEAWRSDVKENKAAWEALYTGTLAQWGDEVWLDITQLDALKKLMTPRIDLAAEKGCHGVEPDNVDCYANADECDVSGTKQEKKEAQLAYNRWTAEYAHAAGLLVGLKNAGGLVQELVQLYDFAVLEQCFQYNECAVYSPFPAQDKPVFAIEYHAFSKQDCVAAENMDGWQVKHCAGSKSAGTCKKAEMKDCFQQLDQLEGNSTGKSSSSSSLSAWIITIAVFLSSSLFN